MMSDALYKSCKIPVAMMGRENKNILPSKGREHISISRFFFLFSLIMRNSPQKNLRAAPAAFCYRIILPQVRKVKGKPRGKLQYLQ